MCKDEKLKSALKQIGEQVTPEMIKDSRRNEHAIQMGAAARRMFESEMGEVYELLNKVDE